MEEHQSFFEHIDKTKSPGFKLLVKRAKIYYDEISKKWPEQIKKDDYIDHFMEDLYSPDVNLYSMEDLVMVNDRLKRLLPKDQDNQATIKKTYLKMRCESCNVEFLRANKHQHNKSKKHLININKPKIEAN